MQAHSTASPRTCAICDTDISARRSNAKYCKLCAVQQLRRNERKYRRSPKGKAGKRARHRTPHYRQKQREYQQRPEVRQRNRARINRYRQTEQSRNQRQEYYMRNREKIREQRKTTEARKRNAENQRRRNARKRDQLGLVTPDVLDMLDSASRCALCNERFSKFNPKHIDHVIPISKGGLHDNGNLQALCRSCNDQKHTKDPVKFAQSKGHLL